MISALQIYDWEKILLNWETNFNLALGMGPYFNPTRTIEKGLVSYIENMNIQPWKKRNMQDNKCLMLTVTKKIELM